jgi:DNA-binding MarR family transcriptional regulator
MSIVSQRPPKSRSLRMESKRPADAIAYLLKSLHHSLRQAVDEAFRLRRIEMSFAHFVALHTLESEPGVVGAELARRGFVTAQTMNTILRRLEKDGDIERRPHPASMRADSWFITKAGQVRLERAKVVGEAVWTRMLSALKAGEITQLQNLLERCIIGLDVQVEDMRSPATAKPAAPAKRSPEKKAGKKKAGR